MHQYDLLINAVCLPFVNTVQDLGILIDSQLKLDFHINSIVACLFFRCFVSKDRHSLIKAFITYVRPYASLVGSHSSVGLIRKIEAVEKRFTKRLLDLYFLDYHERLALLCLESIELRRLKPDLCMTYKIMFNLVNLNVDNFVAVRTNKITRGHAYILVKSLCKVRARSNFFACRVVDPWNNLDAKSNSFKSLNPLKTFSVYMIYRTSLSISNYHLGVFIFINVFLLFFLSNSVHLYIVTFTRTCTVHSLTYKRF